MEKSAALCSQYIIDGAPMNLTPRDMLNSVLSGNPIPEDRSAQNLVITDESVDPPLQSGEYDPSSVHGYLALTSHSDVKAFPLPFSAQYSKILIDRTLLDAIWNDGHFRIGDLSVKAAWRWDLDRLGGPAAWYASVQATCEHLDSIGVPMGTFILANSSTPAMEAGFSYHRAVEEDDDSWVVMPYRTRHPRFTYKRKHPSQIIDDPESWIVYAPMDTCDFCLGGSLLSAKSGIGGGAAPEVGDADYFLDCWELVREMVEDGVVIAGDTVGDGGLLTTLEKMLGDLGCRLDLGDMMKACKETDIVKLLFAEVPGVIIQIRDEDYDYLDAEFTLQDVAYFPLGHPRRDMKNIEIQTEQKSKIQNILDALIRSQPSEGED